MTTSPEIWALTVTQPWAAAIASGHKTVENRTWPTRHRGALAIHAGRGFDYAAVGRDPNAPRVWAAIRTVQRAAPGALDRGAIIAMATLADCHPANDCCTPWAEQHPGIWHWALTDIHALDHPIPCRGRQRLWTLEPAHLAALRTLADAA